MEPTQASEPQKNIDPNIQDNSNQGTEPLQLNKNDLESKIIEMLKSCYDPEIPVDIYQLGLIYKIQTDPEGKVNIEMTLTSPQCPVAGSLPPEVERKIKTIEGVSEVKVEVVWDPPWEPSKMTDAAKLQLGML